MAIAVAPAANNPNSTHSKRTRTQITEEAAPSAARATRSNAPSAKRQRPSRTPAEAAPVNRQPPHHKQQREETSEGGDAEGLPASDTAAECQVGSGMAATTASAGSVPDERFAAAAQFSEDDDDVLGSDGEAATAGEVTDDVPEVAAVKKVTKSKGKLSEDKLQRMKAAYEKRGVVYISRIPPHMVISPFHSNSDPANIASQMKFYLACPSLRLRGVCQDFELMLAFVPSLSFVPTPL